jgi:phosphohistidine phosphatase
MKLYFLRHGKADWPNWDKPDDERPLTKKGAKEMQRMARLLQKLGVSSAVLSSPLPRALQTAEIVAECLCADLKQERALGKGFNAAKLREIIKRNDVDELMIVGHEPDFSAVIRALTGGDVKLGKGGVARVDIDKADDAGQLVWLIQSKLVRVKR